MAPSAPVLPRRGGRRRATYVTPSTVERTNTWNGFTKGQDVELMSPWKGRHRLSHFEFRAHCRNIETGHEWVELYGGRRGHPLMRAFPLEALLGRAR